MDKIRGRKKELYSLLVGCGLLFLLTCGVMASVVFALTGEEERAGVGDSVGVVGSRDRAKSSKPKRRNGAAIKSKTFNFNG